MKTSLIGIALLITVSVLAITGCSTNTQQQNTGIGAVTGAVVGGLAGSAIGGGTGQVVAIAAGAIAGAFIGGYIGHNMDHSDHAAMSQAMDKPTNKTTTWKNPNTGARYSITPTSKTMASHGYATCRQYRSSVVIDNKKQTVVGTACQQQDGTWKTV